MSPRASRFRIFWNLDTLRSVIEDRFRSYDIDIDIDYVGAQNDRKIIETREELSLRARRILLLRATNKDIHIALFPAGKTSPEGPCVECFDRKAIALLSGVEQSAQQIGEKLYKYPSPYMTPVAMDTICALVSLIARRQNTEKYQSVYSFDLLTAGISVNGLLPDSFCCCSSRIPSAGAESRSLPMRKRLRATSGRSRTRSLQQLSLPFRALANPVCGTVGFEHHPGYAPSIHTPIFGQYVQRPCNSHSSPVAWGGFSTSTDLSRIAGVLEALERQAGRHPPPPNIAIENGSYADLTHRAIDPELLFAYGDECYRLPLGLTRYTRDLPIDWVWGHSLTSGHPILVPLQLARNIHQALSPKLVENSSSGCALGTCHEEAILKALLELIERDSFMIGWHAGLSFPKILPNSVRDPRTRLLLERMDYLGLAVSILDARLDLSIPVVIVTIRSKSPETGAFALSANASFDPEEAVSSAITEAATIIQSMPTCLQMMERSMLEMLSDFTRIRSPMDHPLPYAFPQMAEQIRWIDEAPATRHLHSLEIQNGALADKFDISEQLSFATSELRERSIKEIVAIDLTTREQLWLGLKTVRVVAPGLAPIDFGFPRERVRRLPRYRTAPAAKGLPPRTEDGGNPLPHPFS